MEAENTSSNGPNSREIEKKDDLKRSDLVSKDESGKDGRKRVKRESGERNKKEKVRQGQKSFLY